MGMCQQRRRAHGSGLTGWPTSTSEIIVTARLRSLPIILEDILDAERIVPHLVVGPEREKSYCVVGFRCASMIR